MISQTMASQLAQQFNMELYSSYFYLALSSRAETDNLKGISDWFMAKHFEEQAHAMKIYHYLKDQDVDLQLQPVAAPPADPLSALQMLEATLAHEREVTQSINDLVDQALTERDHATNIFLQWFVTEQIEEEATVNEILGRMRLFGERPEGLMMIDKELSAIAATLVQAGASGPSVGTA